MSDKDKNDKKGKDGKFGEQRADRVKAEAIDWLWPIEGNMAEDAEDYKPGRIPRGMLTVIAGRPGEGKSMSTAFLAALISNRSGERSGVMFSNMEDPVAQVLRPRLESAGAKLENIHFFNFSLPRDQDALASQIEMMEKMIYALNIGLIIADPIAAHLQGSLYNDQDVRRILSPLTKMLARTNTAMVAVAHTNKHVSKNAHPLSAIGGSGGGLVGAARAVFVFGKDPEDESIRVLAPVKFNLGPMGKSIAFDMENEEWTIGAGKKKSTIRTGKLVFLTDEHPAEAIDILAGKKGEGDGAPAEKKAIAAEWLTGLLSMGPMPAKLVREEAADQGISWATLRRAAEEVGVKKPRKGFGPGSYIEWMLPDGHPALQGTSPQQGAADAPADADAAATDMTAFETMLDEDETLPGAEDVA